MSDNETLNLLLKGLQLNVATTILRAFFGRRTRNQTTAWRIVKRSKLTNIRRSTVSEQMLSTQKAVAAILNLPGEYSYYGQSFYTAIREKANLKRMNIHYRDD